VAEPGIEMSQGERTNSKKIETKASLFNKIYGHRPSICTLNEVQHEKA
jgi:hypothetical protein